MSNAKRILVVEDDAAELAVVEMVLRDHNYEVMPLSNGQACLDQLHTLLPQTLLPDLIILDIQLPDISGYEICEVVKNHALTQDIPIMMLTSNDLNTEYEAGFDAGANEYMVKPIDSARLISTVESIITLNESDDKSSSSQA